MPKDNERSEDDINEIELEGNENDYFLEPNEPINDDNEDIQNDDLDQENEDLNQGFIITRSDIRASKKRRKAQTVTETNTETSTEGGADNMPASLGDAHKAVEKVKDELLKSKVKHFGITFRDSKRMVNVKNAINDLRSMLSAGVIGTTEETFTSSLERVRNAYRTLIGHCETYVSFIEGKNRGKSKSGKLRLRLTKEILAQSRKELTVFEMPAKSLFEKYSGAGVWTDILYDARAERISENDSSITKMGAGTSVVYRKQNENGSTSYIKEEERIAEDNRLLTNLDTYASSGLPGAVEMVSLIKGAIDEKYDNSIEDIEEREGKNTIIREVQDIISKYIVFANSSVRTEGETKEAFKERAGKYVATFLKTAVDEKINKKLKVIKDYVTEHYDTFVEMIKFIAKKTNEFGMAEIAGIAPGEIISNRNVSTSRLAQKLGIGNLIAKSETVLIETENGNLSRANSMEGVDGLTLGELLEIASVDGIKVTLDPAAIKQLATLQIFDLICGQVDRNVNNYIATCEIASNEGESEYIVTSLKGIDNDMAFGAGLTTVNNRLGTQTSLEDSGKIALPYLPRDFYERIMEYTPEEAAYDQMDIRNEDEIKALQTRLELMKKQLTKLLSEGKLQLLDNDADWENAKIEMIKMHKEGSLLPSYIPYEIM